MKAFAVHDVFKIIYIYIYIYGFSKFLAYPFEHAVSMCHVYIAKLLCYCHILFYFISGRKISNCMYTLHFN
jgi:hypothetical protein